MRRSLIISGIAIAALILGGIIYFFLTKSGPAVSVAPSGSVNLPVAGQGGTGGFATTPDQGSLEAPVAVGTRLTKISAGPVVPGVIAVDTTSGGATSSPETSIEFIERASGNVFSYLFRGKTLTRVSSKTIPSIQNATWLPDGSVAFVRYLSGDDLSTVNTYALSATSSTGFFLPQNLTDIAVSTNEVLELSSGVNGSTVSRVRIDGSHSTSLFSTPLSSVRVSYAGRGKYLAFSRPSGSILGSAFIVDGQGVFSRVAGPHFGLVALASHSGKYVLVSYTQNNALQMELVDTSTNIALQLPIATIADKCVWTADDSSVYCGVPVNPSAAFQYPDDWYQGAAHFSDRIWRIETAGRYAQLVLDPSTETADSFDIESPAINPSRTVFVFTNKNDGSLWSYAL